MYIYIYMYRYIYVYICIYIYMYTQYYHGIRPPKKHYEDGLLGLNSIMVVYVDLRGPYHTDPVLDERVVGS